MYRPQELKVKKFLTDSATIPFYKEPPLKKREPLKRFCRTTGNHGFVHLVDDEETLSLKIIWAIVIAILALALFGLIYNSVTALLSERLSTEILESYSNADPYTILPDIHICDSSIFSARRLQDIGFNDSMASYLALATTPFTLFEQFSGNTSFVGGYKKDFDRILENGSLTMGDVISVAALNCTDMVWACAYGNLFLNATQCCERFFNTRVYVSIFGSCVSTHGRLLKQSYLSRDAGFIIYARPNLDDAVDFVEDLVDLEYILQTGIYYSVSTPVVDIQATLHYPGRFALPRTVVSLPISKKVIDNSELKHSNLAPYTCADADDSYHIEQKTPGYDYYSQSNCGHSYVQEKIRQNLNCSAVFLKFTNPTQLCKPYEILSLNSSTVQSITEELDCPLECVRESYQVSPSYSSFNKRYLDRKMRKYNYTINEYQLHKIHVKTYLTFFAEIGGNLGLFLGASIISLAEIVVLILRCGFELVKPFLRK